MVIKNGDNNNHNTPSSNLSLYEHILSRFYLKLNKVINELQLSSRFNLADVPNAANAIYNLGLSNVINYRQLAQSQNLGDLTDVPLARQNLGLGDSVTKNTGMTSTSIARGNTVPIGGIIMWNGSTAPDGYLLCNGATTTVNGTAYTTPDLSEKFILGYKNSGAIAGTIGNIGGEVSHELTLEENAPHDHDIFGSPAAGGGSGGAIGYDATHSSGNANDEGFNTSIAGGTNILSTSITASMSSGATSCIVSATPPSNIVGSTIQIVYLGTKVNPGDGVSANYNVNALLPNTKVIGVSGNTLTLSSGAITSIPSGATVNVYKVSAHNNMPPYYVLAFIMFVGFAADTVTPLTPADPITTPGYSSPTTGSGGTDGGYSDFTPEIIGETEGTIGCGITLLNPQ